MSINRLILIDCQIWVDFFLQIFVKIPKIFFDCRALCWRNGHENPSNWELIDSFHLIGWSIHIESLFILVKHTQMWNYLSVPLSDEWWMMNNKWIIIIASTKKKSLSKPFFHTGKFTKKHFFFMNINVAASSMT